MIDELNEITGQPSSAAIAHPAGAIIVGRYNWPWLGYLNPNHPNRITNRFRGMEIMSGQQTNFSLTAPHIQRWRGENRWLVHAAANRPVFTLGWFPSVRTGSDLDPFNNSKYYTHILLPVTEAQWRDSTRTWDNRRQLVDNALWLVFYSLRDAGGEQVWPRYRNTLMHWHRDDVPLFRVYITPEEKYMSRQVTLSEILERISAYRPGVMPMGYRLRVAGAVPEEDILWPQVTGGSGILEYHWLILIPLVVATTPYRILFYLPLLLVPRILVWPTAIFWAMLWIAGWVWSIARYRRLR